MVCIYLVLTALSRQICRKTLYVDELDIALANCTIAFAVKHNAYQHVLEAADIHLHLAQYSKRVIAQVTDIQRDVMASDLAQPLFLEHSWRKLMVWCHRCSTCNSEHMHVQRWSPGLL